MLNGNVHTSEHQLDTHDHQQIYVQRLQNELTQARDAIKCECAGVHYELTHTHLCSTTHRSSSTEGRQVFVARADAWRVHNARRKRAWTAWFHATVWATYARCRTSVAQCDTGMWCAARVWRTHSVCVRNAMHSLTRIDDCAQMWTSPSNDCNVRTTIQHNVMRTCDDWHIKYNRYTYLQIIQLDELSPIMPCFLSNTTYN